MEGDSLIGYLIRIKPDDEDGASIPLVKGPCVIGRSAECQIRLKNPDISERHCMIQVSQQKKVTVHSLNSKSPVLVNENEVNGEGHILQHGDTIKICDLLFRWNKIDASENDSLIMDAAHLSLCSESSLKKALEENRRSLPEYLLKGDGTNKDMRRNLETISDSSEECFGGESTEQNRLKRSIEECGSTSTKTDSDEDIFSDALCPEEISTPKKDQHCNDQKIPEENVLNSVSCNESQMESISNILHAVNDGSSNKKSDDDDSVFEDSSNILNETSNVSKEDATPTIREESNVDLNTPEKDIPESVTENLEETEQNRCLKTPQHSEQADHFTLESRSLNKFQGKHTEIPVEAAMKNEDLEDRPLVTIETTQTMNNTDQHTPERDNSTPPRNDSIVQDAQNSILKTPKCFEEAYHSTPNARSSNKLRGEDTPEPPLNITSKSLAVSTPDMVESPTKFRGRRSTGIVPNVGTPSEVYRCKRSILTPSVRLSRDSAPKEPEISSVKVQPRRRSSERKSTPLKQRFSDRSIRRESILHSPIIEDEATEKCEESQNESLSSDPKFKFVQSRKRRRFGGSSFATENRILEESETSLNELTGETVHDLNEEEEEEEDKSLIALSSCDDSELPMTARIIINGDRMENDNDEDTELNSTFTIDTTEAPKDDSCIKDAPSLKSILTPMPKGPVPAKEKSVKKVTFARNVVAESYDKSSLDNSPFTDSYDLSAQQSSCNSNEASVSSTLCSKIDDDLDSFCKNEELFMSERSQSSVFSQNSTSTPVKASVNTTISSEKLKNVTRFLKTWDKSFESSRTPQNPKNDLSSATPLTDVSAEDNVDLTALQDAENKCSENRASLNKTNERSSNSTREITDEFVTPSGSKLIDSMENSSEVKESCSGVFSQNCTSTPACTVSSADVIEDNENECNEDTFGGVAELLKTPCVALPKLDVTANASMGTSHLENSKSSTGVTPQLKQLKLNKTVSSTPSTPNMPYVLLNRSGINTKSTPSQLSNMKTSTLDSVGNETNVTPTIPNAKIRRSAVSATGTPHPKMSRTSNNSTGTPHPRMNRTSGTPYPKSNNSANFSRAANSSNLRNGNETMNTTRGTPYLKLSRLDETANSAQDALKKEQETSLKKSEASACGTPNMKQIDVTGAENVDERSKSSEKTISLENEVSLETSSSRYDETLPEEEDSAAIELMVSESPVAPEETREPSILPQTTSESEALEEVATQDVSENEIMEEAETQLITENSPAIEGPELDNFEEADTQDASECDVNADAETQLVTDNVVEKNEREWEILDDPYAPHSYELDDVGTQDIPPHENIEKAGTQETTSSDVLVQADTQDVSHDEIIEEADTQEVCETATIENAETQVVENVEELQNFETESIEEIATQSTADNVASEVIEEADARDNDVETVTSDVPEAVDVEPVALSQIIEGTSSEDAIENDIPRVVEEGDTQACNSIEEAETQLIEEDVPRSEVLEELETQDVVEDATKHTVLEATETEDTKDLMRPEVLEEAETQDILEDVTSREMFEEAETQDVENDMSGEALEDAETQAISEDVSIQELSEDIVTRDTAKEVASQEVLEKADFSYVSNESTGEEILEEAETQAITEDVETQLALELENDTREALHVEPSDIPSQDVCPSKIEETTPAKSLEREIEVPANNQSTSEVESAEQLQTVAADSATNDTIIIASPGESGPSNERTEESAKVFDTSECAVTSTNEGFRTGEIDAQENESASESRETEYKPTLRPHIEIILSRTTESPNLRRSHRISRVENSKRLSKSNAVDEPNTTPSSRKTPKRLESDQEKSTSKRTRKDRDNQENEIRFSVNNDDDTPARKRVRTPLKKEDEKLMLIKPTLQLPKLEIERISEETNVVSRRSTLRKDAVLSTEGKRRALKKLDNNELIRSPSKGTNSTSAGSMSPFSIVLPILQTSSTESVNDENRNAGQTRLSAAKMNNEQVLSKSKRVSKKRSDHAAEETDVKIVSPNAGKRTRKQKSSTDSNASNVSTRGQSSSKRGAKKTNSAATSPASTSSVVGSPKRATRKRRIVDSEPASEASPVKRTLRGRQVIATIEETPTSAANTKSKRAATNSRVKASECVPEVKSKRTPRVEINVETTEPVVEVKRATRSKRNADVSDEDTQLKKKPITRGGRKKTEEIAVIETTTNRRGAKNRQPTIDRIEAEPEPESINKRSTRNKRAADKTETEPEPELEFESIDKRSTRNKRAASKIESENKRPARKTAKKEVQIEEITTKPTRARTKGKTAPSETNDVENVKSARVRITRSEAPEESTSTVRSTRLKKNDSKGSSTRGPSVTVSRMSLKLKVVQKRSPTTVTKSRVDDDEPQKKRVKICSPVRNRSGNAKGKKKTSTKAIISKTTIATSKKTKSDSNKSTTKNTSLKKPTKGKSESVSPSLATERATRTTRSAKTKTATRSASTSRTTRKK